jgi:transposase
MFEYRQILVRMRQGESDRDLAKAGLIGRKTAKGLRALAAERGWLDASCPLPEDSELAAVLGTKRKGPPVASSIEAYREQVQAWADEGIAGTTIYRALVRNHQFAGSYSAVRRFLQGYAARNPVATTVLEFAPSEAAQVDFGAGPELIDRDSGEVRRSWVFVMTLCYSRHQYAEIVWRQDVETWLACHRRAFEWFGGVPAKLTIDNAKCAITRACARDPEVQRAYAECAEGYGFLIDALPARQPQMKGRVEAGVKYIKGAFLPLRTFRDLDDANRQLAEWVMGEAGNRVHGTTRKVPLTLFAAVEKPLLKALPDVPPELSVWAKVKLHGNCHVQFQKCLYSAPYRLIAQQLWLKASDTSVKLYRDHELVAVHPRLRIPGSRHTVPEHLPPEALAHSLRDPQWCLKQADTIGPACHALIERLFAQRVLDNLRAAQGIIALAKRFGPARLEAACARALAFDQTRYRSVKTILEKGLDQSPSPAAQDGALSSVYTGAARFLRDTSKLFH